MSKGREILEEKLQVVQMRIVMRFMGIVSRQMCPHLMADRLGWNLNATMYNLAGEVEATKRGQAQHFTNNPNIQQPAKQPSLEFICVDF